MSNEPTERDQKLAEQYDKYDHDKASWTPGKEDNPTNNPAMNVFVVSEGIVPNLPDQEAVDEVASANPPAGQVPAQDPTPEKASEREVAQRTRRGSGAVPEPSVTTTNDPSVTAQADPATPPKREG